MDANDTEKHKMTAELSKIKTKLSYLVRDTAQIEQQVNFFFTALCFLNCCFPFFFFLVDYFTLSCVCW